MLRRRIAALLVLLGCLAVCAASAQTLTSGDFVFEIVEGKATLTGYTGSGGRVTVPGSVSGYPVAAISAEAFRGNTALTSVQMPESVCLIPANAFNGCTALTRINVPSAVSSIGMYAFRGCTALTQAELMDGLYTIDYGAFQGCTALTEITIPSTIKEIKRDAFRDSGLTTLYMEATYADKVDASAFPASLETIWCSVGCLYVRDRQLDFTDPDAPDWMLRWERDGDEVLLTLVRYQGENGHPTIPDAVEGFEVGRVAEDAMLYAALDTLHLPDSILEVGAEALRDTDACAVVVPEGCRTIGSHAFAGLKDLYRVELPNSLTSLPDDAFSGCPQVTLVFDETNGMLWDYVQRNQLKFHFR